MPTVRRGSATLFVVLLTLGAASACADDDVSVTRDVPFGEFQGLPLLLDRYETEPSDDTLEDGAAARPAIVMFHGGGWAGGDKADLAAVARGFARAGFVAFSANYAIPPPGQRVPAEIDTTRQAVEWVIDNASDLGIDPGRVGLYGSSAGGNLALMVAMEGIGGGRPPIGAVASWSGPTDLTVLSSPDGQSRPDDPPVGCMGQDNCIGVLTPQVFPEYVGCTLADCPEAYAAVSPVNLVRADAPPTYLTASERDLVPFDQAVRMADALEAVGGIVELAQVPGDDHGKDLRRAALDPTIAFFEAHLR
jgi:acetyl esterase